MGSYISPAKRMIPRHRRRPIYNCRWRWPSIALNWPRCYGGQNRRCLCSKWRYVLTAMAGNINYNCNNSIVRCFLHRPKAVCALMAKRHFHYKLISIFKQDKPLPTVRLHCVVS